MIGRLRGILLEKQVPYLLIDVSGVAYEVQASMTTCYRLPEIGHEVILHTHFVVREDAQLLYGFFELRERALFRTLIKVNGIGPKLALTILSSIDPDAFVRCIHENDTASLVRLPGVGKKTAERIIVEIRDRLASWQEDHNDVSAILQPIIQDSKRSNTQDAISALIALGYKPQEASRLVAAVEPEASTREELIRLALRGLVK